MRSAASVLRGIQRRMRAPRGGASLLRSPVIAHDFGPRPPNVPAQIVPDLAPTEADVRAAARLSAAYHRAIADDPQRSQDGAADVWTHIRLGQRAFHEVLDGKDARALAAYLCNMCRHDATRGTVQGDDEFRRISADAKYRAYIALMAKDKLVSLAEAVGAIPCENPEQGSWGTNLHLDADDLVARVERLIGIPVAPPDIDGGLLKLSTSRGLFNERDLNAIYTAWMLRQQLPTSAVLAEIGAGSGRVAHWAWKMGFRSYTIFDLPHVNVVQGFYLLKALPDADIALYGEPEARAGGAGITILPHFRVFDTGPGTFDLVLNQDSFPEIHADVVRRYLGHIRSMSRRHFLSINHESGARGPEGPQLNVPAEIARVGGYRRVSRALYWLRRGYAAELYEIADHAP
jgi:hypothetical protein